MSQRIINSWHAVIYHTLDTHHNTIKIRLDKAYMLQQGLAKGGYYYLSLEAGYEVEIIKVLHAAEDGILYVERGQINSLPGVWPAGSVLEGKISAKVLDELHLDPQAILASNAEVILAPNGDLITKPLLHNA